MDILGSVLDGVLDVLNTILSLVVALLPPSPFNLINNSVVTGYMGYINWIVPVSEIVAIMQVWLVAIGVFYIYRAILKWIGQVQ